MPHLTEGTNLISQFLTFLQETIAYLDGRLRSIPDVVWAAFIAAGVAYVTTRQSNKNSRRQLQMQLNHDAGQQERDRAMALRRDVYLPAAEAIARCSAAPGQLTNARADQLQIQAQLTADLATISKVHLIGSVETVRSLMAFQKALVPAFIEVLSLRTFLVVRLQSIEQQTKFMDRADAEQQQLLQLMKEHRLAGSADDEKLARINALFESEQQLYRSHADQRGVLLQKQNAEQQALAIRLGDLLVNVSALVPDALLSARDELALPIDHNEYRRLYAEQQNAARAALLDAVARAREMTEATATPSSPPA